MTGYNIFTTVIRQASCKDDKRTPRKKKKYFKKLGHKLNGDKINLRKLKR